MLTVVAENNTETISIPLNLLAELGISVGEEIELHKRENGEIVLRQKQSEKTQKILQATREIIENRKSALIELGKGQE